MSDFCWVLLGVQRRSLGSSSFSKTSVMGRVCDGPRCPITKDRADPW